jgi:hypothetical protein
MPWRDGDATVAGHEGWAAGWTASSSLDDSTATTVAVTSSLEARPNPAVKLSEAVRQALGR